MIILNYLKTIVHRFNLNRFLIIRKTVIVFSNNYRQDNNKDQSEQYYFDDDNQGLGFVDSIIE